MGLNEIICNAFTRLMESEIVERNDILKLFVGVAFLGYYVSHEVIIPTQNFSSEIEPAYKHRYT